MKRTPEKTAHLHIRISVKRGSNRAYTEIRAISGTSLRDSIHFGSRNANSLNRPYKNGFNSYSAWAAMDKLVSLEREVRKQWELLF